MSLSSYLRELIHDDVSHPAMAEVLARIAARGSIEAEGEDVRSFIEDASGEMTVVDETVVRPYSPKGVRIVSEAFVVSRPDPR